LGAIILAINAVVEHINDALRVSDHDGLHGASLVSRDVATENVIAGHGWAESLMDPRKRLMQFTFTTLAE
jgi:hypothetical protein